MVSLSQAWKNPQIFDLLTFPMVSLFEKYFFSTILEMEAMKLLLLLEDIVAQTCLLL